MIPCFKYIDICCNDYFTCVQFLNILIHTLHFFFSDYGDIFLVNVIVHLILVYSYACTRLLIYWYPPSNILRKLCTNHYLTYLLSMNMLIYHQTIIMLSSYMHCIWYLMKMNWYTQFHDFITCRFWKNVFGYTNMHFFFSFAECVIQTGFQVTQNYKWSNFPILHCCLLMCIDLFSCVLGISLFYIYCLNVWCMWLTLSCLCGMHDILILTKLTLVFDWIFPCMYD